MKLKSLVAFLLCLLIILATGCSETTDEALSSSPTASNTVGKATSSTIRLLYSSKDPLDPYTCVTEQNTVLSQMIFEPLISLNNQYEIEYRLAKNVLFDDMTCIVELRDAKFSDGTPLTAADVVFSFNKAKNSTTTRHQAALKYATSALADGDKKVLITLSRKDPNFAQLLTFPILKKDSDKLKDSDNRSLAPIGTGRFVFDNATAILTPNKYYYGGTCVIKKIETVDCPDNESVNQAITAGMVDLYYTDLSNNVIPKMNGTSATITQTNLVFLGINPESAQLSNSLIRQALSTAIDRQEICSTAYFSKATPALGPLPTVWKPTQGYLTIQSTANIKTATSNIELAGFTKKDKDGYYLLLNNKPITLTMLVNSENEFRLTAAEKIVESCAACGIKVNLKAVDNAQYENLLKSGSYDLYLGEIRFEENMDIGALVSLSSASSLLPTRPDESSSSSSSSSKTSSASSTSSTSSTSSSGSLSDGESSEESEIKPGEITLTTLEVYKGYYEDTYSLQDLITAFTAELPVIPICFKNGLVIYSDRFGNGITPSRSDLFHGIQYLK